MRQAIAELAKNERLETRREELRGVILDPERSPEDRALAKAALELIPPMSDGDLTKYIRVLTGAAARAEAMLGEEQAPEVTVTISPEAEEYAR